MDQASIAGDAISLKESLETILKHPQACHDLARVGQQTSMKSIEPAFENLHFLRIKHKMGKAAAQHWKECVQSAPMVEKYEKACDSTLEFAKNAAIAQGAIAYAGSKNGGGRGHGGGSRGRYRRHGERGGGDGPPPPPGN